MLTTPSNAHRAALGVHHHLHAFHSCLRAGLACTPAIVPHKHPTRNSHTRLRNNHLPLAGWAVISSRAYSAYLPSNSCIFYRVMFTAAVIAARCAIIKLEMICLLQHAACLSIIVASEVQDTAFHHRDFNQSMGCTARGERCRHPPEACYSQSVLTAGWPGGTARWQLCDPS